MDRVNNFDNKNFFIFEGKKFCGRVFRAQEILIKREPPPALSLYAFLLYRKRRRFFICTR